MDRRRFLKVTAITGTSAALASCGSPENQVIRFVPDDEIHARHRGLEAERVPVVRRRVWRHGPRHGRGRRGDPQRAARRDAHGARQEARGRSRAPAQPGEALRPRPGGRPGHLSPRSHRRADAPEGDRGGGEFAEISWDEALKELVDRLDAVISARALHRSRSSRARGAASASSWSPSSCVGWARPPRSRSRSSTMRCCAARTR